MSGLPPLIFLAIDTNMIILHVCFYLNFPHDQQTVDHFPCNSCEQDSLTLAHKQVKVAL